MSSMRACSIRRSIIIILVTRALKYDDLYHSARSVSTAMKNDCQFGKLAQDIEFALELLAVRAELNVRGELEDWKRKLQFRPASSVAHHFKTEVFYFYQLVFNLVDEFSNKLLIQLKQIPRDFLDRRHKTIPAMAKATGYNEYIGNMNHRCFDTIIFRFGDFMVKGDRLA